MGSSTDHPQLTNLAEQLEASLTQVRRTHERLQASLARSLEHEQAMRNMATAAQQKQLAESALVTDNLCRLAAIFGGSDVNKSAKNDEGTTEALSRLEAKLDALSAKVDNSKDSEARGIHKVDDRLAAIQATLGALKDSSDKAFKATKETARSTSNATELILRPEQLTSPPAQAEPTLQGGQSVVSSATQDRKRKRGEGDVASDTPQPPVQLSNNHQDKLRSLAYMCSQSEGLLLRLLPCPDGGLWKANQIYDCVRLLFKADVTIHYARRLNMFMHKQSPETWCCVRRAADDAFNSLNEKGDCTSCHASGCVQIRRAAEDGSLGGYYHARVMFYNWQRRT